MGFSVWQFRFVGIASQPPNYNNILAYEDGALDIGKTFKAQP